MNVFSSRLAQNVKTIQESRIASVPRQRLWHKLEVEV